MPVFGGEFGQGLGGPPEAAIRRDLFAGEAARATCFRPAPRPRAGSRCEARTRARGSDFTLTLDWPIALVPVESETTIRCTNGERTSTMDQEWNVASRSRHRPSTV
jgi:hypothetical protein